MTQELFDLNTGYIHFKNPVAIAPMAGITDSSFVNSYGKSGALVIMGGYNLDEKTNAAACELIERGRKEFVSHEPIEYITKELNAVDFDGKVGINLRSSELKPLLDVAEIIRDAGALMELDAHCRQPEMKEAGVGEALMEDLPRLADWIRQIKETGVVLSVKIRANVVDDIQLAKAIESAGADIIHVDAMKEGAGADLEAIRRVRDATRIFLIGNNSVQSFDDAKEMFSRGADMVSVGRQAMDSPQLIDSLVDAVSEFQEITGWYNAPKHICRGQGDLRGMTFCCLPVKPCAVHNKAKQLGFSPREFANLKMEFVKGTPLEYGDSTCFGSLAWCCKITKPCFMRDGVLDLIDLSPQEYMKLKKQMADYILDHAKEK